jgi:phosphatidylinositol glycan class O
MDNDTVLILFGDHGMTEAGGHGGETNAELRTILFAYSKTGLPIK